MTIRFATTDLCDDHEPLLEDGTLRVLPAARFAAFGGRHAFAGPVVTLRVFEDNAQVRATLEGPGQGRVLVIDGGGSLRTALVGGKLGKLAQDNGWVGIVVHGCVRDVVELAACDVGIRALGACPRRSRRAGEGARDVQLDIAGVSVRPGDWCYADEDGVLVAARPLHA